MRISSGMFPFASHEIYGYSLDYAAEELKVAGEFAARNGHRLTTHPGQYNQLGSPRQEVIQRTITELTYHADMLNLMNLPLDSIMIIHMGGSYGDKVATLKRFEENYKKLNKKIKNRLALENDEIGYSIEDLLPLCKKLKIPLVLDWHHHSLNPGTLSHDDLLALIPEINKTWTNKGLKPKQHYSEGRPGAKNVMEKRAHSARVTKLPPCDPDMDLMIEAKDKEQAVFQLYQQYGLFPVDPEVIIPPAEIKTNNIRRKVSAEIEELEKLEDMNAKKKRKKEDNLSHREGNVRSSKRRSNIKNIR